MGEWAYEWMDRWIDGLTYNRFVDGMDGVDGVDGVDDGDVSG